MACPSLLPSSFVLLKVAQQEWQLITDAPSPFLNKTMRLSRPYFGFQV